MSSEEPNKPPFFFVQADGVLQLTVTPDDLCVCRTCPHLHVRVFAEATPANLRRFAAAIFEMADRVEKLAT